MILNIKNFWVKSCSSLFIIIQARNKDSETTAESSTEGANRLEGSRGMPPRKFWISWSSNKLYPAFWGVFQQEIKLINNDTITQFYSLPNVIQPNKTIWCDDAVMKLKCAWYRIIIHHTSNSTVLYYMYGVDIDTFVFSVKSKIGWSLWSIFAFKN